MFDVTANLAPRTQARSSRIVLDSFISQFAKFDFGPLRTTLDLLSALVAHLDCVQDSLIGYAITQSVSLQPTFDPA